MSSCCISVKLFLFKTGHRYEHLNLQFNTKTLRMSSRRCGTDAMRMLRHFCSSSCPGNAAPHQSFAVLLFKSLAALLAASFLLERARKKTAMVRRGESKREGEMQSAFDWAMIARAPQLQLRINRKRIANQSHSTPNYDHKFSAIIVGSIWATSLAASAD